ncbi:MAG: TolC family protein [Actinobacteria bacterium]|nr:TolC family protein [Actinomycetota bacterium]
MIYRLTYMVCLVATVLGITGGCVNPGPTDSSLLGRSQRALADRGPQARKGDTGLDSLRPEKDKALPEFEVAQDEESGKKIVRLGLDEAVMHALVNNLDIRVISFEPAIAREQVIEAASEFDYTVFGGGSYTKEDKRNASRLFSGAQSKTYAFEAGVKKKFVTGAETSLTWAMIRAWDNTGWTTPNPYYEPTLVFEISQPLLRDAWAQVNLANLQVARLNQKITMAQFRDEVERIATEVISDYWGLVRARRELEIAESLLNDTAKTLQRVESRGELDATAVQINQIRRALETRRAIVVQAQKNVFDAQDTLARLLADAQINVLSEYEIVPIGKPNSEPMDIDTNERLAQALEHNPTLEQAQLAIEMADIDVDVAQRQKLPQLNLTASAALQGLDDSPGDAHDWLFTGNYFGFSAGLNLEYPLGNRQREAEFRRSKFNRLKAIATLQNLSDQVAVQVKERARQVESTYKQWQIQQEAVKAARTELQALEDTEQIRGQLTPEFLAVKLGAQAALAEAERAELQAITDYNISLVELERTTGTVLQMYPVPRALSAVAGE